jgi:uncharacterized protein
LRYWEASALLPLIVEEAGSELASQWLVTDDHVCTWAMTRVELASTIERRTREGRLTPKERRAALELVTALAKAATEIIDVEGVRDRATQVLARHALRAADAAQLGAALTVVSAGVRGLQFVTLDRRLADAASREGLDVVTWDE